VPFLSGHLGQLDEDSRAVLRMDECLLPAGIAQIDVDR